LTTLMTSVDVLNRRRDELSDRSRQALDLIVRDLQRFRRALEDLLALGRLEAGAARLVLGVVDLRELACHAVQDGGHSPDLVAAPDVPVQVWADKAALHRALLNLVENADRHGHGLTGVTLVPSDEAIELHVDDAGPGVPVEERDHVFERFVRGGSRGSLPGTGLGLSLVLETVRAHHGTVWCGEAPAGGARFTVRLPRHRDGGGDL
jgi:signal transduction histidine kinase